jgi:hypothetical protein
MSNAVCGSGQIGDFRWGILSYPREYFGTPQHLVEFFLHNASIVDTMG